jgi:hypothetical protein
MRAPSSASLESVCDHCGQRLSFTPEQLDTTANCPRCKKPVTLTVATATQLAAAPAKARTWGKKFPAWLLWMIGIFGASLMLTFAMAAMVVWIPTLGLSALWQLYWSYMFFVTFVSFCGAGLAILFLVYVFISLTEMRVLLREIAANTRPPKTPPNPPEPTGQLAGPSAPKPLVPPEDAKYLPTS